MSEGECNRKNMRETLVSKILKDLLKNLAFTLSKIVSYWRVLSRGMMWPDIFLKRSLYLENRLSSTRLKTEQL